MIVTPSEFSSSEHAAPGRFDAMLLRALERYDAIMEVMLPTLGEERQQLFAWAL